MSVKMNLRVITKNHEADPKIEFLSKSISKPYGRATAMPPSWELKFYLKPIVAQSMLPVIFAPSPVSS